MERTDVAERTALLIHELENLLDDTLNKSGELVAFLPTARREAGLSAVFGQQVFERAGNVIGHLIEARRAVVDTHNGCEAVRRKLQISMTGPNVVKPLASGDLRLEVIEGDRVA